MCVGMSVGFDLAAAPPGTQSPPAAQAQAAPTPWAPCEPSGGVQSQQEPNLCPWPRLYPDYFEKVLRWAAQDPSLRLPYWNYTGPAQEQVPAAFRATSSVLYDDKRNPHMA